MVFSSLASLRVAALVTVLPCLPLSAQNLVTNGDFEGGTNSSGLPNGWTFSGYALSQKVDQANVTGGAASNCFNCRPGGQQTPPPYPPYIMDQNVLLVQGVVHEFRADIMAARPNSTVTNADAGTFEVFADGVSIAKRAFGSIGANQVHRDRLCARVVPKSSGFKVLRITFHRNYLNNNNTPVSYIDNIFLGRTQGLTVCFPGERKAGGSMKIAAVGTAAARFGLFLAAKNTTPYPIPPWTGQWELAAPFFPLVIANLDQSGQWSLSAAVPAAARGVKAWIQGIEAPSTSTVLHLGYGQEVNVY